MTSDVTKYVLIKLVFHQPHSSNPLQCLQPMQVNQINGTSLHYTNCQLYLAFYKQFLNIALITSCLCILYEIIQSVISYLQALFLQKYTIR